MKKKQLEQRVCELEEIIRKIAWMARRYADNRSTFAPMIFNECLDKLYELGIDIGEDSTLDDNRYAKDGMFGVWNPNTKRFEKK